MLKAKEIFWFIVIALAPVGMVIGIANLIHNNFWFFKRQDDSVLNYLYAILIFLGTITIIGSVYGWIDYNSNKAEKITKKNKKVKFFG